MAILALDQGTSGSKAIVVDEDGVHAVVENTIHPSYLPGGAVEQDPMELYNSVIDAGKEAIKKAGKKIDGVSLANQGETILAWDPETGEPLTTCIVWQDRRSEVVVERLREHSEEVHQRTGLVLDSYFTAPKMVWLRENLTKEGVVTTTDTWILHRLTNEFVTDVSTASRSLLLNVDEVEWDARLLEIFSLSDEMFPRLVACDEIIGTTTVFGDELPVGGLIVDQQAALFAEHCLERGQGNARMGPAHSFWSTWAKPPLASTMVSRRPLPGSCATKRCTALMDRSTLPPRRCGGCRNWGSSVTLRRWMKLRRTIPPVSSARPVSPV